MDAVLSVRLLSHPSVDSLGVVVGIIGAVNNILPVRCLDDHISLNRVPNGPRTRKDIHQRLALCTKIAVARGDM